MIQNAPGAAASVKPDRIEQLELQLASTVRNQQRVSADKTAQILLTAITSNSARDQSAKKGPESTEEVYCWGSNSSQQLTDAITDDKLLSPRRVNSFGKVSTITAGQYCTFVIQSNGSVVANGKGNTFYYKKHNC